MNRHVTRWISAYYDGELRLDRRIEVEEHLRDCMQCRRELEQLHNLSALLQEAPLPVMKETAQRFAAREKLPHPPPAPRLTLPLLWKAAWQAAPLLLVIGWTFAQAFLAFWNLSILSIFTYVLPAGILELRLESIAPLALVAGRLGILIEASPWILPTGLMLMWISASLSLTFYCAVLCWGWLAGWWAARAKPPAGLAVA